MWNYWQATYHTSSDLIKVNHCIYKILKEEDIFKLLLTLNPKWCEIIECTKIYNTNKFMILSWSFVRRNYSDAK